MRRWRRRTVGIAAVALITSVGASACRPMGHDTDGDGVDDVSEIALSWDVNDPDQDGDGVPDGDQDSDSDGFTDYWELAFLLTNPYSNDSDGDTLEEGQEVWVYGTAPHLSDSDNDGLRDDAELFLYYTNPLDADYDDDGLEDGLETSIGTGPTDPDSDDGGVSDGTEYSRGTNPLDSGDDEYSGGGGGGGGGYYDTDGDYLADDDEWNYGTDLNNPDTDYDGLTDYDEIFIWTSSPLNWDSDSDGYADGYEVLNGGNPLDPNMYPGSG